jgi:hypothetical protein
MNHFTEGPSLDTTLWIVKGFLWHYLLYRYYFSNNAIFDPEFFLYLVQNFSGGR